MNCLYNVVNRKLRLIIVIVFPVFLFGCSNMDPEYEKSILEWHQLRIKSLKSKTGFLNLAGLYWLEQGVNSFGSDSANALVFPEKASQQMGAFLLKDSSVYLVPSSEILVQNKLVEDTLLVYNDSVNLKMQYDSLLWYIIKRGKDFGIRLRDFENPVLTSFDSIDYFPINADWVVKAKWKPYDQPKNVDFQNMVGMTINYPVYGEFLFTINGNGYSLEPLGEPEEDEYFIMFYDNTSGHTTYGSGRYLYVAVPDESGYTTIDFNKAYNPPCAFTEFATCLFPHKKNRLPIFVNAGEKFSGH